VGVVGGVVAVAHVVVIVEVLPTMHLPHPLKILGISQPWVPSEVSQNPFDISPSYFHFWVLILNLCRKRTWVIEFPGLEGSFNFMP